MKLMTLLVAGSVLFAADPTDNWENLECLRTGHRVEVVDASMKYHRGALAGVTEEAILLDSGGQTVSIERERVVRVQSLERSKRKRNAVLGLAIGAGIGGLATYLKVRSDQPIGKFRGEYWGPYTAAILLPCLGGGSAIGAAVPSHPTLYRSKTALPKK